MRRFIPLLLAALFLLGSLLALSCGSGSKSEPAASPTAAATAAARTPAATPAAKTAVATPTLVPPVSTAEETAVVATPPPTEATNCAAGTTAELRDIAGRVDWAIYCPTYLPPGYEKELIGGPNPLQIQIANSATGARIYFVQGTGMDLSSVTALVHNEGEFVGSVPYGDLEGQLFRSLPGAAHGPFTAVLALPEGEAAGLIHYIEAYGVSEDEMRPIADGMRRVDTIP